MDCDSKSVWFRTLGVEGGGRGEGGKQMTLLYSLNLFTAYMTVVRDKCCVVRLILQLSHPCTLNNVLTTYL